MPEDRDRRNARQAEYMRQRRTLGRDIRSMEDRICVGCCAPIRVRRDKSTSRCSSCSRRTSALRARGWTDDRLLPIPATRRASTILPPSRPRWFAGYCRRCAAPFTSDRPQDQTCSKRCAWRDKYDRRRARKAGAAREPIRRAEIFARDEYRCKLCGDPLAMAERVPHPLAPTIDHVTPLARGGAHTPSNVQAAHFLCNSRKSDNVLAFCSGEGIVP